MPYSGQLSISSGGGATYQFMTPDGSNVTVALYLQGELVGAATLNASTTTAKLGGGGGVGGSTAWSANLTIAGGTTTLGWSNSNNVSGSVAAWPTP